MPTLTIQIQDTTIYNGPAIAVPNVGEAIDHDGQVVAIQGVVWNFEADGSGISVQLVVGSQPYTF